MASSSSKFLRRVSTSLCSIHNHSRFLSSSSNSRFFLEHSNFALPPSSSLLCNHNHSRVGSRDFCSRTSNIDQVLSQGPAAIDCSWAYMEPEVVEISHPSAGQTWKSKAKAKAKSVKQKEVANHEIIDVDGDDVVIIEGEVQSNKKRKGGMGISLGPGRTRKKAHSNNKGKEIQVGHGHSLKSFIDLDDDDDYSMALQLQSHYDNMDIPTGIKAQIPLFPDNFQMKKNSSSMGNVVANEDVVERYESFKKFDIVVDYSDHFYAKETWTMNQKNLAKRVQYEWRILEESLPGTMDLLRAVIIGAEGTPYHDCLFFFDVYFTSSYPEKPPLVHYHSAGYLINPNLYTDGKVCVSLLTWGGSPMEKWIPGYSTMLQLLVSIQGLILNNKPYYNDLNGVHKTPTATHERASIIHNESFFMFSLKTMVYTMGNPLKNFEDFVRGHFRKRVRDIFMACKAYTEGVRVGCVLRGAVQDLCTENICYDTDFKACVVAYVKTLVAAFKQIGVEEAEEFIWLSEKIFPTYVTGKRLT